MWLTCDWLHQITGGTPGRSKKDSKEESDSFIWAWCGIHYPFISDKDQTLGEDKKNVCPVRQDIDPGSERNA